MEKESERNNDFKRRRDEGLNEKRKGVRKRETQKGEIEQ